MNLFKIMQSIRGWAQAGKIDFPGAVKYLTDLGVKMDGIVHQALKNVFKEGKARDPDFGNVVQKLPIDDAGIPFNPKTLKSTKEKRGITAATEADKDIAFIQEGIDDLNKVEREADLVSQKEGIENLFDEKLPKVKMGSRMNYEKIADMEGIDVELIRGKNWSEIRAIIAAIRDKADGGRVGFVDGGWADDLTGQGLALYNSMTAGGHSDEVIQDTLTELGYWSADGDATETVESIVGTDTTQGGDNDRAIRMPITKKFDPDSLLGTSDYFPEPQKTGILQKAKSKIWDPIATAAGVALDVPLGLLTSGAKLIGGMLPYNERAVMENKMLESGFALDDIGRIVAAGDYNTPEGIMAGYNAAQMTEDTFDKRMNKIRQSDWQNKVNQQARINLIQKAKEQWQLAQDATSKDKIASQGGQWHTTGGGQDTPGAGGQNVTSSSGDVYGGAAYGYNEAAEKSDYYKKGGLATMFTRRR